MMLASSGKHSKLLEMRSRRAEREGTVSARKHLWRYLPYPAMSITVEPTRSGGALLATAPRSPEGGESFKIEFEQEEDGRWIAEIPELPGVMVYGSTKSDAEVKVTALALRVLADRTEEAKKPPKSIRFL